MYLYITATYGSAVLMLMGGHTEILSLAEPVILTTCIRLKPLAPMRDSAFTGDIRKYYTCSLAVS
jgi:hypothetical protein